jgi:hypothetical protein
MGVAVDQTRQAQVIATVKHPIRLPTRRRLTVGSYRDQAVSLNGDIPPVNLIPVIRQY